MSNPVSIVNAALANIGCLPIASFDITSDRIQNIKRVYDSVVADIMSKARWQWNRRTKPLTQITGEPDRRWQRKFALPPDRVNLPFGYWDSKSCSRPLTRYEISDSQLWCDAAEVWALYQIHADPALWPGYFAKCVILDLMAEYALSVREDMGMRTKLKRELQGDDMAQGEGGQMAVAMMLDAQAAPQSEIDGGRNPLISSRYAPGDAREGFDNWGFP